MKLTQAAVLKVKANAGKKPDYIEWDDVLPGFGLRVRGATSTWVFQYKIGDQHRRLKLGKLPELNCDSARKLAEAQRGKVAAAKLGHGVDPAVERQKTKEASRPETSRGNPYFPCDRLSGSKKDRDEAAKLCGNKTPSRNSIGISSRHSR